jgi:putative ABC transport system permease protein
VRRTPALSTAVAVLMTISIGAATATFSVVNAVLIEPLPLPDADRIVMLWEARPDRQVTRNVVSGHEFPLWQERAREIEALGAMTFSGASVTLTDAGEPLALSGVRVTSGFFQVLRTAPIVGRTFRETDDVPGRGKVVILSQRLWSERFGGNAGAIGRTARLDGESFEIVGVMPATFDFPRLPAGDRADFWVPIAEPIRLYRGRHFLYVVGRLRPDSTLERAQEDMNRVAAGLAAEMPALNRGHEIFVRPLQADLVRAARPALLVLAGAVAVLVLVGCSNIASLLLAKSLSRRSEIAVRLALGATTADIGRQALLESLMLTSIGATGGVLVALWLARTAPVFVPRDLLPVGTIDVDLTVLAFAAVATIVAGLLSGAAPALQARAVNLTGALAGSRTVVGGHSRLRGTLVASQVALAVVLVAATAALVRGLGELGRVDPGFEVGEVFVADVTLPATRYAAPARIRQFSNDLLERITASPGVVGAAVTNAAPLGPSSSTIALDIEGREPEPQEDVSARYRVVSPGYFETLGIALRSGRTFAASDARRALPLIRWFPQAPLPPQIDAPQPPPVAVVNDAMARRFWPGLDPLGRRFRVVFSPWITVVGRVADTRNASLKEPPLPEFYLTDVQEPQRAVSVIVRTQLDPAAVPAVVRSALIDLDPSLAVSSMQPLEDLARRTFNLPRFTSTVVGAFASLSLVLMAAGVYALALFTSSQRAREVALRMALGAGRRQVVALVLGGTFRLIAVGAMAGSVLSVPVLRLLDDALLGTGVDAGVWISATATIGLAVVAGCWIPARRTARVNAAAVLKQV